MTQSPWLRQTSDRFAGDAGRRAGADSGAVDDAAPTEATARADVFIGPSRCGVTGVQALVASTIDLGDFSNSAVVRPANAAVDAQGGLLAPAASPETGGFSINLATGQNASGVIQTSGDLADAHWIVSNSDNYKQAPIAFTVAPDDVDWYPSFRANGPNSSWIAADPDNVDNGEVTYTITFNLTGYNPADATLVGGQFVVGDAGTVYLNGHVIGSEAYNQFVNFNPLSSGAGDFVAGINTLVIQTTMSDKFDGAARFEGTVVDTVTTNPPGPIHWASAVSGNFSTAADWTGGLVPSSDNDAILDAAGKAHYTVTASTSETVGSLQTSATATLDILAGTFEALSGTGAGANAGTIEIDSGASLSVGGAVANSGLIALAGELVIAANTTLSGVGWVALTDSPDNKITGGASAATLTNLGNTITGAGIIGSPTLTLVNGSAGIIDATGATALVLATGSNTISNAGLIEATGAGGLTIAGTSVDGSAGGTLLAANGSRVILHDATLIGGELESTGSGLIRTGGRANTLDGRVSSVTNAGALRVATHTSLTLEGAIDNTGRIEVRSFGQKTDLIVGAAGATLSGGGFVTTDDNANDAIVGATFSATLTNVDDTIMGAGALGGGTMILVNEAAGVIDGDRAAALTIDTGANAVVNAGLIEATRGGRVTVESAVDNTGTLFVAGGSVLTLDGDVTGAGTARIHGGTLDAAGAFSEDVAFAGRAGALGLAQSQSYAGTVSGFSRRGATSLDLGDIAFVGSGEATWSGGVLTVTDGTHTARITLAGDFTHVTFVASADGRGGTLVVATAPGGQSPAAPAHRFTAAMASLAHPAAAATPAADHAPAPPHLLLASPRLRYA